MREQKIIILVGIPGSGKSTWAKQYTKENKDTLRVNRDDFRFMLSDSWDYSKKAEDIVTGLETDAAIYAINAGYNVIIDATNLSRDPKERWNFLTKLFHSAKVSIELKVFDTPYEECVKRNAKRVGKERVPDHIMENMYAKFCKLYLK